MSITITAAELRSGDAIDFGGQPATVCSAEPHPDVEDIVTVKIASLWPKCPVSTSILTIQSDLLFNVQRPEPPDPDAAVIKAMASAMAKRQGWDGIDDPSLNQSDAEYFRGDARAALAAQREVSR